MTSLVWLQLFPLYPGTGVFWREGGTESQYRSNEKRWGFSTTFPYMLVLVRAALQEHTHTNIY